MIEQIAKIENYQAVIEGLDCVTWQEAAKEEIWRESPIKTPHKDTQSIYLRMPDFINRHTVFNELEANTTTILANSPKVQDIILECMYVVGCSRLGRVMIVNLKPGGVITSHIDEGLYAASYRRFHLPLVTNPNVRFTVGNVTRHLKEGLLYEILNKQLHSVINDSDEDRLHLIMDMQLLHENIRLPQKIKEN